MNGFRTYDLPGGSIIDQAYLDGLQRRQRGSSSMPRLQNGDLQNRLAGLRPTARPSICGLASPITSTATCRPRAISDLSGYRYGPNADPAVRGSGEPGVLVVRAAERISRSNGSITRWFRTAARNRQMR